MKTVRLCISGRVQAVGYRMWAERTARGLGLRGWVRNRADGTVELLAAGPEDSVASLIEACRQGPPATRGVEVAVVEADDDGSYGFTARPTV